MRIALGSDHAGYPLKSMIGSHLVSAGHEVIDVGTNSEEPVDYPPFCARAARLVVADIAQYAIVIGGSGQGEAIAANKVHGIRAALCHDETTAHLARLHNDANVLSLGARIIAVDLALVIIDRFLATEFEGGRHIARLAQIDAIESEECT